MTEIINLEVQFFLTSILYGILLLVVYDCIRILRRIVPHNAFFVALQDILFWVTASIVIFLMIYERNNGTIRGFAILGMLLGMIIYNQLLSKFIVKGITKLIQMIINGTKKVMSILLKPFAFIIKKLRKFFGFNSRIGSKFKKVGKSSAKQLKNVAKTVKISVSKK
ncbi:spore cortex biosynthesis protein YabQ [Anaerosporobacter sp.]